MWLLPTRGRPDACEKLIAAMRAVGDCPVVAVMIDDDPARYRHVAWPRHWKIHVAPDHLEMSAALNALLKLYPGQSSYGFFGDHFRPQSAWSAALEQAASDWLIAWPNDKWISDRQVSAAPCFGGKLIAELGWICLPTLTHLCTDNVWKFLCQSLGIGRLCADVIVAHDRPETSGRARDDNHKRIFQGRNYTVEEYPAWLRWREHVADRVVGRLRVAMRSGGVKFDAAGHVADGLAHQFVVPPVVAKKKLLPRPAAVNARNVERVNRATVI